MPTDSSMLTMQLDTAADIIAILGILISFWILFEASVCLTINHHEKQLNPTSKQITLLYYKWCAFWSRGQVVTLLSVHGTVHMSIAWKIPGTDNLRSYIYYRTRIGNIMLHPDGQVSSLGYTRMDGWLPIDVEKRTWMILQGARGFDY